MLVRNAGRLMPKEWLLDEVWSQVFVAEVNLSVTISGLRKLLRESRGTKELHRYRAKKRLSLRRTCAPPASARRSLPASEEGESGRLGGDPTSLPPRALPDA
jgi:hypothetical protein